MAKKKTKKKKQVEKEVDKIEEEITEKRQNRSFIYMLIVIGVIIVGVFFLPKLSPEPKALTIDDMFREALEGKETKTQYAYNGYAFVYLDGLWYTQVQESNRLYTIPFHFAPRQLEDVPFTGYLDGFMTYMLNHPIDGAAPAAYITFDPTSPEQKYIAVANGELIITMIKTTNLNVIAACNKNETEACKTIPIITCDNTESPVIFFNHEGDAGVELTQNCLILNGFGMELLKSSDRFLYALYGIMPAS